MKWFGEDFRTSTALREVVIFGLLCAFGPGLYNLVYSTTSYPEVAAATYATFASASFFSGPILFAFNIKIVLSLALIGYGLSNLFSKMPNSMGLDIFAGVIVGLSGALFWSVILSCITHYATAHNSGRYIALLWSIFNVGGVLGWLILRELRRLSPLISEFDIWLFILSGVMLTAFCVSPSENVRKADGKMIAPRPLNVAERVNEEVYMAGALMVKPMTLLLLPHFIASNWSYIYCFGYLKLISIYHTNLGDRMFTLVMIAFWLFQSVGSVILGMIADFTWGSTKKRAHLLNGLSFGLSIFSWALTCCVQYLYEGGLDKDRSAVRHLPYSTSLVGSYAYGDLAEGPHKHDGLSLPLIMCIFLGIAAGAGQTFSLWLVSTLSGQDMRHNARFVGVYKSLESLGTFLAWSLDLRGMTYRLQLWINFALLMLGLPPLVILCLNLDYPGFWDAAESRERFAVNLNAIYTPPIHEQINMPPLAT